jgi:hypothetical protein
MRSTWGLLSLSLAPLRPSQLQAGSDVREKTKSCGELGTTQSDPWLEGREFIAGEMPRPPPVRFQAPHAIYFWLGARLLWGGVEGGRGAAMHVGGRWRPAPLVTAGFDSKRARGFGAQGFDCLA